MGSVSGGLRSALCGTVSGAVSGCVAGAICASGIPHLCVAGSCVAGFLGSVANDLCMNQSSLTDNCSWAKAILTTGLSCLNGLADPVAFKEKLVTWVLGVDASAWSGMCGLDL